MDPIFLLILAASASIALLFLRFFVGKVFIRVGAAALSKQPDEIHCLPLPVAVWKDPAKMEALANPLLLLGFADLGVWSVAEMPGVKIRFLSKEDEGVAAFLYEYPMVGTWIEFSTRYEDGTTTALSNRAATGMESPPFFRISRADPKTPAGDLYRRLVAERSPTGIKRVTRDAVVPEFELAWTKIMLWQKHRGLTAEEVARVAAKMAEQRRAARPG
ncbi:MAG: hypothetical protein HY079_11275 [Elusimicrobia bacterium]|nr:hypothetical protein [Elusimicrobiota bacterium]